MKSIEELQKEKLEIEITKLKSEVTELKTKLSAKMLEKLTLDKLQSEIEKNKNDVVRSSEEIKNIHHRNSVDKKRFWIGVFAPTISAIALIGTLLFQVVNNLDEKKLKREADVDSQWRTFLSKVNDSSINFQNAILNRSFFSSKYKNEALEVAANVYLPYAPNRKFFELLYKDFSRSIDTSNYRNLVDLTFNLHQPFDTTIKVIKSSALERRNQLQMAGTRLTNFIRASGKTSPLNLRDAYFLNLNIDIVNFGKANINNAVFDSSSVAFADFSEVISAENSDWKGTAWWRAIRISDVLLYYLVRNFPYDTSKKYYDANIGKADEANLEKDRKDYMNYLEQYNRYSERKKRVDQL